MSAIHLCCLLLYIRSRFLWCYSGVILGDLFPVLVFGYVLFIVGLLIPVIYVFGVCLTTCSLSNEKPQVFITPHKHSVSMSIYFMLALYYECPSPKYNIPFK